MGRAARTGKEKTRPLARTKQPYSEAQQLDAVRAMFLVNRQHPMCADSLIAARNVVGSPLGTGTLGRWVAMWGSRVLASLPSLPSDAVAAKDMQTTLLADLANVRQKAVNHLNQDWLIESTSARDTAVVLGIVNQNMDRMTAIPADIADVIKQIMAQCEMAQQTPLTAFKDILAMITAHNERLHPRLFAPGAAPALGAGDKPHEDSA